MGEELRVLSPNRWIQNSYGNVEYSIGNGVAKECIHMTHGHEQWCVDVLRDWGVWVEWNKGGRTGTTIIVKSIKTN